MDDELEITWHTMQIARPTAHFDLFMETLRRTAVVDELWAGLESCWYNVIWDFFVMLMLLIKSYIVALHRIHVAYIEMYAAQYLNVRSSDRSESMSNLIKD